MFTFTQSNTTSAITPIIPIHEDTIEIKSARIIKMVIGFPKYLLKLNNKVCPETIVNLLIAAIKKGYDIIFTTLPGDNIHSHHQC